MPLEADQLIDGKYRIVRLIGTGGMGEVYEGENTLIRRRVAIKILHAGSAGNVESIRRFEREAQAAGHIGSDHILEVLDLGTLPNGDRYMVMEYLDGETLAARIQRVGRLTPWQVVPIAAQILTALAAAHAANIVHRDLKPENVFILRQKTGRPDFVKLIDFGISKFSNPRESVRVTREGSIMGTPCYMSPEQARGKGEADARSDIYACGVILYEAVTGKVPFEGETFNDLMFMIALSDAPDPRSIVPDLDPGFVEIIAKAMARDPARRYQSAEEFAVSLDVWRHANERSGARSVVIAPPGSAAVTTDTRRRAEAPTIASAPEANLRDLPFQATGTYETFGQSKSLSTTHKRRVPMFAAIGVGSIAVVASGVGLMGRSAPPPPPAASAQEAASTAAPRATEMVALPPLEDDETMRAPPAATGVDAGVHAPPPHGEKRLRLPAASPSVSPPPAAPATASTRPPTPSTKPAPPPGARDFGY